MPFIADRVPVRAVDPGYVYAPFIPNRHMLVQDIIEIQPMQGPVGEVFHMNFVYTEPKNRSDTPEQRLKKFRKEWGLEPNPIFL